MAYITRAELFLYGMSEQAICDRFEPEQIDAAIEVASSEADTYLTAGYDTPLTVIPPALKLHVARAAVYHLFFTVGFNVEGDDQLLKNGYDDAKAFYKALQKSQQNLPQPPTSPERNETVSVGVAVASSVVKRGW